MSFTDLEQSTDSSTPVELFKFEFQNIAQQFYYTNSESQITHLGDSYSPVAISRGKIEYDQDSSKEVSMKIETRCAMCSLLFTMNHPEIVKITIYRMQRSDSSYVTVYVGYLGAHQGAKKMTELTPLSPAAYMLRTMLTRVYGTQCPYCLYDSTTCKVDAEDYSVTGTISSISSNVITSDSFATKDDEYFVAGMVKIGGLYYMVLEHTGTSITLEKTPLYAYENQAITAYAGCDHTLQTCYDKFDNSDNNGGDPFQPTDNLFTSGLESNTYTS